MRRIIILLALLSTIAFAQNAGCCCDPVLHTGTFAFENNCLALGHIFTTPPADLGESCTDRCHSILALGACGDHVCQADETSQTCPADCAQIVQGCESPEFKLPPTISATPVVGERAINLTYTIPCGATHATIKRCSGTQCSPQPIAHVPPDGFFIDDDTALQFNNDYTYEITLHYLRSGESLPARTSANLGDIECWHQSTHAFCIRPTYYENYRAYLQTFGYAQYSAQDFLSSFSTAVSQTFSPRFNGAYRCTANRITQVGNKCQPNQYCAISQGTPHCLTTSACTPQDPFGLFSTVAQCETNAACYLDTTTTLTPTCQPCAQQMTCSDYNTQGACQRDHCGIGSCSWHTIGIGSTGVCVNTNTNNCLTCTTTPPTPGALWDTCTEEKSLALSTERYPCFFDKDLRISKSCDDVSCEDYSRIQCASPSSGIMIGPHNQLLAASNDPCGIRVCEYHDALGCVKNADGNTGAGFQDCKAGNTTCELDYFSPQTTLTPRGVAGRTDFFDIYLLDKTNATTPPRNLASTKDYVTYLCVPTPQNDCSNARTYTLTTRANTLALKNTELKDGNIVLATLAQGPNVLYYYSKDPANNIERVRNISFYACGDCSGPILINATVTNGRVTSGLIYTSSSLPTLTLFFDEPVTITYAELNTTQRRIALAHLTPGAQQTHQLAAPEALQGTYTIIITAQNARTISLDPPLRATFVVNQTLADVIITPRNTITTQTPTIILNFTQPVSLTSVRLLHDTYENPYAPSYRISDITGNFTTTDNKTFTARVGPLAGGPYVVSVNARGYNLLDIFSQENFYINLGPPNIRLLTPAWGTTPYSTFNATVETPLDAECAYVYNTPAAPSPNDFSLFKKFTGTRRHISEQLTIPFGASEAYPLHVYCRFTDFGVIQRTINITMDSEQPIITSHFAEPQTIAEQYLLGQNLYATTLHVSLNKEGFCKYSHLTSIFANMENQFAGYDLVPKISHTAFVTVTAPQSYTYYVACKAKNQLTSAPAQIPFTVDLNLPLDVRSSTPIGFSTQTFSLRLASNKRVHCYFGEQPAAISTCMGTCSANYTHAQPITVPSTGRYTYYAQCSTPTGEQSPILEIPVIVDTTPPEISVVDDSTTFEDPDIGWSPNRVRLAITATDAESNVSHALVTLQGQLDKQIVFRDYVTNITSGQPFFIQTTPNGSLFLLINNKRYSFVVQAVNSVGLRSQTTESDGFKLDVSIAPEPCNDGEKNNDETDIDCGGDCEPCAEGKRCDVNADCATNFCNNGICASTSCEDNKRNGLETDIDCGGNCAPCAFGLSCIIGSDCETSYCDGATCGDAPPCADGLLSPGESDIDCGGNCAPCAEGKNCNSNDDCTSGTTCDDSKICASTADADRDGVLDTYDTCPNTPAIETANEQGCGPSQIFSLGDEIDDNWRLQHFSCLDCTKAAPDADPDRDGLTNREEYREQTDPTRKDTDRDGWADGLELQQGYNPLDSTSHPPSKLNAFFIVLLILLLLGLGGIGYYLYQQRQAQQPTSQPPRTPARHIAPPQKTPNTAGLKKFAAPPEDNDWIDIERNHQKLKDIAKKDDAFERLRKTARK